MRFTSTLDVQRTLERMMRRARLNPSYTLGFNPHARLSLGAALPLGLTSECELADVWLEGDETPEAVLEVLRREQPPGMEVVSVQRVPEAEPSLDAQIVSSEYEAEFDPLTLGQDVRDRVKALLAQDNLPRERRGKTYDLRPLIEYLELDADGIRLRMRLASRESNTGRPDEVLLALGLDPAGARICRTRLFLTQPDGPTESHPS
jgi:radical SAM-linked protein